jgi:hypothetical protein
LHLRSFRDLFLNETYVFYYLGRTALANRILLTMTINSTSNGFIIY